MIFLTSLVLLSCENESEPVRILFAGDILLSRNVREEYNSRKTFPWENLNSFFHSSDLVIGNLEGSVGKMDEQIYPLTESPVFIIDSCDVALLEKAGFNAITIENNHSLDLGINGKTRTISTLIGNNIKPVSLENSPYFFSIKGHVISIIAVTLILNRDSSKYQIPSVELNQKLRLAKALSNIVIVSVHWGSELLEWPNKEQRNAAKWFISNGADIIIGHHPHVVQKPELIDGKPVYFSLGNHIFDQKYNSTKEGLIAVIEIKNDKLYCTGIKTRNQKNSFYPEINGSSEKYFEPFKYNDQDFTINNMTIIPVNVDIVNKIILQAFKNNQLLWRSHPMSLVTLQKIRIDDNYEHLFSIESYFSSIDKEINVRPYVYAVDNKGIVALWRGSALAWPILDAQISTVNDQILCALNRGDAFISIGKINKKKTITAYKWNGFGFNVIKDSTLCKDCKWAY